MATVITLNMSIKLVICMEYWKA